MHRPTAALDRTGIARPCLVWLSVACRCFGGHCACGSAVQAVIHPVAAAWGCPPAGRTP